MTALLLCVALALIAIREMQSDRRIAEEHTRAQHWYDVACRTHTFDITNEHGTLCGQIVIREGVASLVRCPASVAIFAHTASNSLKTPSGSLATYSRVEDFTGRVIE